ncbi:MAG: hypothetical protein HYX20_02680 [Candidatus Yanofskybacteria bacterium]|nr:hypothetical protein [Candidatus Yanofskybacteria bacterium]
MGDEISDPVDVVVFFDANMPKMETCSSNCSDKELVFCVHRFFFKAEAFHPGNALFRLDDFQVLQYFFQYIRKNKRWNNVTKKPFFVLVTKDEDFLENDAPVAYKKAERTNINKFKLDFYEDSVSDGENIIFVLEISSKNYGTNRCHNLHCAIEKINKFWESKLAS